MPLTTPKTCLFHLLCFVLFRVSVFLCFTIEMWSLQSNEATYDCRMALNVFPIHRNKLHRKYNHFQSYRRLFRLFYRKSKWDNKSQIPKMNYHGHSAKRYNYNSDACILHVYVINLVCHMKKRIPGYSSDSSNLIRIVIIRRMAIIRQRIRVNFWVADEYMLH